jgi:hypothetical protein
MNAFTHPSGNGFSVPATVPRVVSPRRLGQVIIAAQHHSSRVLHRSQALPMPWRRSHLPLRLMAYLMSIVTPLSPTLLPSSRAILTVIPVVLDVRTRWCCGAPNQGCRLWPGTSEAGRAIEPSPCYKAAADRLWCADLCAPCSSGRVGRPASALLWGRVAPGGMTSGSRPAGPGRHPDRSAGSPVDGGAGSVRPEVVGVLVTSGSSRAGWRHGGLATRRDRATATRSAQPR